MNKSTQQFTDLELLQGFRNDASREKYFALIMQQYQKRVYYYIRRMVLDHDDTDDILQNTFIKVWKGLPNFREESQLYTWIYKIATNETFTFLNSKNKRASTSFDETKYYISGNVQDYKIILEILLDLFLNPAFPEKDINNEIASYESQIKSDFHFETSFYSNFEAIADGIILEHKNFVKTLTKIDYILVYEAPPFKNINKTDYLNENYSASKA